MSDGSNLNNIHGVISEKDISLGCLKFGLKFGLKIELKSQ